MPVPWLVPAIIAGVSALSSGIAQHRQNKKNREMAEFQAAANQQAIDKQNAYNSPAAQMKRFQDARLNPNLIYGQGNPGNQSSTFEYPRYEQSFRNFTPEAMQLYNQTSGMQAQVQAQTANTQRTGVLTQLNKLQADVLRNSPMLDKSYVNAMIQSMIATAASKESQAAVDQTTMEWFTGKKSFKVDGVEMHGPAGVLKMETELKLLLQRFSLGSADQQLKNAVLKSKEFQNALQEIQLNWMKDGDITPQHIYQFIQMLLMKML